MNRYLVVFCCAWLGLCLLPNLPASKADEPEMGLHAKAGLLDPPDFSVVPESTWQAIESSVDRGITFLLRNQNSDGSFGTGKIERPAITALAGMAMISRGHLPDQSPNATSQSRALNRAIDYILKSQDDSGMLGGKISAGVFGQYMKYMVYNHAICGLFLAEVYGMTDPDRSERIEASIEAALRYTRQQQMRPMPAHREAVDRGGWRYPPKPINDDWESDLSVSSWYVMFLRSAENAGFDVPIDWARQAVDYVLRCYVPSKGVFKYVPEPRGNINRGIVGAGVISLFLTGHQEPSMEEQCGKWLVKHPFDQYNIPLNQSEHYHYSVYYGSQAALQIGGSTWESCYPILANTLVKAQHRDGGWDRGNKHPQLGNVYTSSLAILALTPPYQLLPIYQR